MRHPIPYLITLLCITGCKPEKVSPAAMPSQAPTPAPASSNPPTVKVVLAYEPPVAQPTPKVDPAEDEKRKLHAYIREERIRQIEAAKSRVEALMRAIEPEKIETDFEVLRALGQDPSERMNPSWQATAKAYREQKAKARERQNRALEDAQAHLRSLLLGTDEKTIAIPVR
jgi:hypothetical protein